MAEEVSIRILFFAKARELVKSSEETIVLKNSSITARLLFEEILSHWPILKPLQECIILARNQSYLEFDSEDEIQLLANDEVAVIPPISSGTYLFVEIK